VTFYLGVLAFRLGLVRLGEATAKDASLTQIDEAQFLLAAAHKVSAVKIPLAGGVPLLPAPRA